MGPRSSESARRRAAPPWRTPADAGHIGAGRSAEGFSGRIFRGHSRMRRQAALAFSLCASSSSASRSERRNCIREHLRKRDCFAFGIFVRHPLKPLIDVSSVTPGVARSVPPAKFVRVFDVPQNVEPARCARTASACASVSWKRSGWVSEFGLNEECAHRADLALGIIRDRRERLGFGPNIKGEQNRCDVGGGPTKIFDLDAEFDPTLVRFPFDSWRVMGHLNVGTLSSSKRAVSHQDESNLKHRGNEQEPGEYRDGNGGTASAVVLLRPIASMTRKIRDGSLAGC